MPKTELQRRLQVSAPSWQRVCDRHGKLDCLAVECQKPLHLPERCRVAARAHRKSAPERLQRLVLVAVGAALAIGLVVILITTVQNLLTRGIAQLP